MRLHASAPGVGSGLTLRVCTIYRTGRISFINPRGGYGVYLVTSDQMQVLDNHAISNLGVPGIVLMDHAGKAVADVVMAQHPQKVVVCVGKGNNGGDGWITARWCHHYGRDVEVVSLVAPETLTGDAKVAATSAIQSGVGWRLLEPDDALPTADVYVDALLGTGLRRPIDGALGGLIDALNTSEKPVVAVDVPSGVNPSTGEVTGPAVQADQTVCFAVQKLGTAVSPGCYFSGRVRVADIGIPVPSNPSFASWIGDAEVRSWLPQRTPDAHKGTYGRTAVWVGEMRGAASLSGLAALRTGAGLVVQLTDADVDMAPEFVVRRHTANLGFATADCDALVFGPGLGRAHVTPDLKQLLSTFTGNIVVDADGLQDVPTDRSFGHRLVLTPHPKECARMLGWSTSHVQAHRLEAVLELVRRTGAVVVLKGYHTLVASPLGSVRVNPTGDTSLATAGTGDVLAGMIGSLLAQGLAPFDAACCGVWLHGRAGELSGEELTPASVIASDVVDSISRAIRSVLT